MNSEFEKYKMKGLIAGLEILNGQIIDLTNDYLKLVEENDKLKNEPESEQVRKLSQKILEKDKEIIHLKSRLEDCIAPQEFKEISNWFSEHLAEAYKYNGEHTFEYHKLRWELISTGLGYIRRVRCSCGAGKDFSEKW